MNVRSFLAALIVSGLLVVPAAAQTGNRQLNLRARVLDVMFAPEAPAKPYFLKMTLRFGDTDTQVTVVIYPGGKGELTEYRVGNAGDGDLSAVIAKMLGQNPNVTASEVASHLKVDVTRTPIVYESLKPAIDELKKIRISPVLGSRIVVDEYSEYEFWYDTWQESVHYTITSPFNQEPQGALGRWMVGFRSRVPRMLSNPATK